MKKMLQLWNLMLILGFALCVMGCESKAEKQADLLRNLGEEYIEDMNNAQSLDEAKAIHRQYEERARFETNKLSEEERTEYERNVSWEEKQEFDELNNQMREARDNARDRFDN